MNALYYYAIAFVVIWTLAYIFKDKTNISIEGITIMLKTEKLEHIISKIASISPRFWKYFINISIPLGFFFMVLMVVSLIISLKYMFNTPTVSLILPGVDIPGSPIYIPFATGFLALATVLIIHEGAHGVLARAEGISIDSVGLLLFAVIPGAFVEPNKEELEKLNGFSKIRIYFAGPMANISLCLIALIITMGLSGFMASENLYTSDGMQITSVVPASPAEGILGDDMIITHINNNSVNNISAYSKALSKVNIGDNISLTTNKGTYSLITEANPNNSSKSYIGIRAQEHQIISPQAKSRYGTIIPTILPTLHEIFYLIFFLNFAVGTFNLLPMKPLDGGLILEEIFKIKIRPDRRLEFNRALNRYTRIFPKTIRCFISKRFNNILNFLSRHELEEKRSNKFTSTVSQVLMFILILLVVYGFAPAINSLI